MNCDWQGIARDRAGKESNEDMIGIFTLYAYDSGECIYSSRRCTIGLESDSAWSCVSQPLCICSDVSFAERHSMRGSWKKGMSAITVSTCVFVASMCEFHNDVDSSSNP